MFKKIILGIVVLSVSISVVVGAIMLRPMIEDMVRTAPPKVELALAAFGLLFFAAFVIAVYKRTRMDDKPTSGQKEVAAKSKPQTQTIKKTPISPTRNTVVILPRKETRPVPERPVYAADGLPEDVNAVINYILEHSLPWPLEHVADAEGFVDLIHQNTDQEMWLQLVGTMNCDIGSTYECLSAMVDHSDCQNAVAVAILHKLGVVYCFTEARSTPLENTEGGRVILKIIERHMRVGFPSDGIADRKWMNRAMLLKALTEISEPHVSGVSPPESLVAQNPTGPVARERYFMDECSVSMILPPWKDGAIQDMVS